MKLVRINCDSPSEAADLISFLEYQGFDVQIGDPSDPHAPIPDFEIDLRTLPTDACLNLARELAAEGTNVVVTPGVFAQRPSQPGEEPVISSFEPMPQQTENVAAFETTSPEAEELAVTEFESRSPQSEDLGVPEFVFTAPMEEPLLAQSRSEDVDDKKPLQEERSQRVPNPVLALAWGRLRNSLAEGMREAALTARECAALCSAELLNGSERSRQWLAQARMVLVRKRALVEARATRARFIMETRLRLDPSSQNAWTRSAFAGAGLMIVLIALMLWNHQRIVPAGSAAVGTKAAASKEELTPPTANATPAGSTAVTATLHRHLPSDRAAIVDDQEVVIRHYDRRTRKTAVAIDTKSGIKHISDMD